VVGVGTERSGRRPMGPATEVRDPGDGGGEVAVARERRPRPRLTHEAGAQHDEIRLHGAQHRGIETARPHDPGLEGLGHTPVPTPAQPPSARTPDRLSGMVGSSVIMSLPAFVLWKSAERSGPGRPSWN